MTSTSPQIIGELYNIPRWSSGYFTVSAGGDMLACPEGAETSSTVSLAELSGELAQLGLTPPVLVRFSNILQQRIKKLHHAFKLAMDVENYQADYLSVYPIKVNQQRHVVEEILRAGGDKVGLEAGSKPELLAVLALAPDQGTVICNGYKDREYIRLALIGIQLGLRVYIVIDNVAEVPLILEESKAMNIIPRLGVRIRLASLGVGKWQNTGGEYAKFGLSAAQLLTVLESLRQADLLHTLTLMHFHMGSQIPNIRNMQKALHEAARFYAELHAQGAPLRYIDVGGGLGVDYEGTCSRNLCSINYSIREYANDVVHAFWQICLQHKLPQPHIITEAGRSMTAHHAVLITNVTGVEEAPGLDEPSALQEDEPMVVQNLWHGLANLTRHSAVEVYHDAVYWLSEAHSLFNHGVLNLPQRVRAEQLYFVTCRRVRELLQSASRHHRLILDELNSKLADKYFCNFSLFQSLPDAWAIDQVFPIVPLQRLNEYPERRAILQDLTCDSDGRIRRYVDADGVETSLPLHTIGEGENYLLGVFLVGAYQEILGDLHNLFGDTHAVNVELKPGGGYHISQPEPGDTVEDMLSYVHFHVDGLRQCYRHRLRQSKLSENLQLEYFEALQAGLSGYTYLED